jgi:hypothetical protein
LLLPNYTGSAWNPNSGVAFNGAGSAAPSTAQNDIAQATLGSACSLHNLSIRVSPNLGGYGGNDTLNFYVVHNGATTAIECSLTVSSSNTETCSDTTHTVSASEGDLFAFYFVDTNGSDASNTPYVDVASSVACD